MKTITISSSLVLLASSSLAQQFGVTSNPVYNPYSLTPVEHLACSVQSLNISGGVLSTIGEISALFGGSAQVAALPSSLFADGSRCGLCWQLTDVDAIDNFFHAFAIDNAGTETFVIQDDLELIGSGTFFATEVDRSNCGLR